MAGPPTPPSLPPPLAEGLRYRRSSSPPARSCTLVRRAVVQGSLREYSNGAWIARCFCGTEFTTTRSQIRTGSPKALCCGCLDATTLRKPRTPTGLDPRHVGRIYGRLQVIQLLTIATHGQSGFGCVCECGAPVIVTKTQDLGLQGVSRCPHHSTSTSTSTSKVRKITAH